MTAESTTDAHETDVGVAYPPAESITGLDAPGFTTAVLGVVAIAFVAIERAVTVLANVPFDPLVIPPSVRAATGVLALVAVGSALLAATVADGRATVRVGLLFAVVFGALPLVAPGTTLVAAVAVTGGGALALLGTLGVPAVWTYRGVRRRVVAVGFVAALALTLAGATGLVDGLRNSGAFVTLAAVAAVGTHSAGSRLAAGAGLLAVGAVAVASAASPFAFGSSLLVAFAVTGVPSPLIALAVAGAVAAAVAGLHRGGYTLAVGAVLLLLVGVPATFPRALTLLLGATLVLVVHDSPGTRGPGTGTTGGST
ncbi:phosphate ABC transporter permease [Salinirubellus sp. GCM10025818]|uniref:hypothetical protein n=1 Tax=Salinirubellus TaxID=2162630 RepID=UPI0030D50941